MSTLTKTFVILNLIFSVAFVMVSATVLSQRQHWKNKHAALTETHTTMVRTLNEEKRDLNEINGNLRGDLTKFKALAERREDQLTDRDTAIREKDDTIVTLKKREGVLDSRLDVLTQNTNRLASDLADAQKSLGSARDELHDAKTALGVRNTTVVGLRAQIAGLDLKHKELLHRYGIASDRLDNYKRDMNKLAQIAPAAVARLRSPGSTGGEVEEFGIPPIRSTVRAVDAKMGVVVLGVGSRSEVPVKKGYRFLIYRGRTFVAKVSVVSVDAEMCAARVVDPPTNAVIQVGDKAVTQ